VDLSSDRLLMMMMIIDTSSVVFNVKCKFRIVLYLCLRIKCGLLKVNLNINKSGSSKQKGPEVLKQQNVMFL
jgi:hypothetical protein